MSRYKELKDLGGCSCHISPPCGFCVSLTEDEADVFCNDGFDELLDYVRKTEDENEVNPLTQPTKRCERCRFFTWNKYTGEGEPHIASGGSCLWSSGELKLKLPFMAEKPVNLFPRTRYTEPTMGTHCEAFEPKG